MAPRPPTKPPKTNLTQASSTSNPSNPSNPSKTLHPSTKAPTKELKRRNKHATLLARITKPVPGRKVLKRRRPSKKLLTNLEALADALPESTSASAERRGDGEMSDGKIKHRSLKSRPGARKKKEKLVAMEMERFGKNMALLSAGDGKSDGRVGNGIRSTVNGEGQAGQAIKGSSAPRWAAIRGFIEHTMERREDGKSGMES